MLHMETSASRDIHSIHPYTNLKLHETQGPLVITEGDGVFVRDENGKTYLEALSGLCASAGVFSERRLAEAAYRQMLKLPYYHTFAHKATDVGIELAERLLSIAPVPMSKVFFVNSGSKLTTRSSNWSGITTMRWDGRRRRRLSAAARRTTVLPSPAQASPDCRQPPRLRFAIANILHVDCPHWYRFGQRARAKKSSPAGWPVHWNSAF